MQLSLNSLNQQELKKYAELLVKLGVNLQPGQPLLIRTTIETAPLVRLVTEAAYQAGAKHVMVVWSDQEMDRIRLQHAPEESLSFINEGLVGDMFKLIEEGGAALSIFAHNPSSLQGIDPERAAVVTKAVRAANRPMSERLHNSLNAWSAVNVPTPEWAQLVFPDLPAEEAYFKLWDCIKKATRLDREDPVAFWKEHVSRLEERMRELTERQFVRFHYKAPGTDLTVDLPKNHRWIGGSLRTEDGVQFFPNLPTEEVFSAPLKTGVNGTLRGTRPLSRDGQQIDGIQLTFKDGRITEAKAEVGEEILNRLLDMDENARYLGEIALVPQDSTISNMNLIFHETLFDENASCHFAFGSCYPMCVQGGEKMSHDELTQAGLNTSLIHVDFMIGSSELSIDGETETGERVPLFREGNWVK